jgi:prepilin-type N-terminal cleavage/methylation domain-containing protein
MIHQGSGGRRREAPSWPTGSGGIGSAERAPRASTGRAPRCNGRGGFTLLEIAVALAILGVGIVSCLQIFGASLRMQSRASRESRAVMHARVAMDALLFQPDIRDHEEERDTAEGFHTHVLVRHATVEEGVDEHALDLQSETSLRYLQVDVTWQDGVGAKSYTLKSLRMAFENE